MVKLQTLFYVSRELYSRVASLWYLTDRIAAVVLGGVGYHIRELPDPEYASREYFKVLSALQFTFGISLGMAKLSICTLLWRIFSVKKYRILIGVVTGYQVCWLIMTILIGLCLCRPFAYNWNKNISGKCGEQKPTYVSIAVTDLVGDTLLVLTPLPMIWKLHTSISNKIGLTFIFTLGFL